MTIALSVLLLTNGVWAFIVWPAFFRRVRRDPRARDSDGRATAFLRVHAVLIGISLVLAALSLVFGVLGIVAP